MEQPVQNQLSMTDTILKILPPKQKPKRMSYKTATKKVKNAVKGKTKNISKEQGFRQYLKYVDPLLQNNDELDQSDLAGNIAKIINALVPNKVQEDKLKEVQKFIKQEPIDIKTEVIATVRPDRNIIADAAEKRAQKKQNEAATKIQKITRGSRTRQTYNVLKEGLDKSPIKKKIAFLETGTPQQPLIVLQSPMKTRNYNKQNEAASKIQQFMKENTSKPSRKEATRQRQRGRPVGSKNRTPEEKQQDTLNKLYKSPVKPKNE